MRNSRSKLFQGNKWASLAVVLILLNGCQDGRNEAFLEAFTAIDQQLVLYKPDVVLVIPNAGCTGCIGSAEEVMLTFNDGESLLKVAFLLTSIRSKKVMKVRYGRQVMEAPYVFCDFDNVIEATHLASPYPCIVYLNNGAVSKIEEVSPQNPHAIDNLLKEMYNIK